MSNALATMGGMQAGDIFTSPDTETTSQTVSGGALPVVRREKAGRNRGLSRDQKAAVIVRLLANGTDTFKIDTLEPGAMLRLVHAMASLRHVDEATILSVIDEFLHDIDSLQLYFKSGLNGAIETLDPYLGADVRSLLAETPDANTPIDPWVAVRAMQPEVLGPILSQETPQICAIALAKLPATLAATILADLPADFAHSVTLAVAKTDYVARTTVQHIGAAIKAAATSHGKTGALDGTPIDRIGAILNYAPGSARQDMLKALDTADSDLTDSIRAVMFTFGDIPDRIEIRDVPKLVRAAENQTLVTALAGALTSHKEVVDFILSNLSKRLSEQLNEEVLEIGDVKTKDADAAMNALVQGIRDLETSGDLIFISPGE